MSAKVVSSVSPERCKHLHRIEGLAHRADLVHLRKQRVARLLVHGLLQARFVGNRQVVPRDLRGSTNLLSEERPSRPSFLVEGIPVVIIGESLQSCA